MDSGFKKVMSNRYLLARVLQPLVSEFEGMTEEQVRACLPVDEDNSDLVQLNTELPTPDDSSIRMDMHVELTVPVNGESIKIDLNIEGQSRLDPRYGFEQRAVYYAATLIHAQKPVHFSNDDYGKLRKVYSIWFILTPRRDQRNSIFSTRLANRPIGPYNATAREPDFDYLQFVTVNIGGGDDYPGTDLGLINTLFGKNVPPGERVRRIGEVYNIREAYGLSEGVNELSRTLEEDFILAQKEEALEEALESGIYVTREHAESMAKENGIETCLYMARKMLASGSVLDDIVKYIPEEFREEVSARLNGSSF